MGTMMVVTGVLGLAGGLVIGLMMATGTIARLRDEKLSMAGDVGLMAEEMNRLEAYSAELERDKAIAMESSDRWRGEAFDTQNKLAEATELLATEKRRAAALLGHNRRLRSEKPLQCQP
jgi:hypothetical protein